VANQAVLDDFTDRWNRGEIPGVEAYLALVGPVAPRLAVELIYREYCLAERDGRRPDDAAFLARFPLHRRALEPLLEMHRQCTVSEVTGWIEPAATEEAALPDAGDEIGPYMLRRELGRGSFARVFLAEQADLEYRQVVVKVSTRPTREPWLLARARHAHIVEILYHAEVDDGAFQLICMPFLGGATLSTLLAHRRGNRRPRRARGGLLEDLDAVAAPEYAGVNPARPARELLRSLTDHQAMAWMMARLAEALDHAFSRDVVHGDVKPSNIILTADGNPMLLDFNLAQDWSPHDANQPLEDHGGTVAYMAPERLRALASSISEGRAEVESPTCPSLAASMPVDPHRADLYALGKVLLEALTGTSAKDLQAAERPDRGLREAAESYAADGERGTEALIASSEILAARPIPRALKAILRRCLAANPADRYRRGLELAEDLDRWRTDRPLAYAAEPFWAQTLPRWVRGKQTTLSAAALIVLVSLTTGFLMLNQSRSTLMNMGLRMLARSWDDIESHAFQLQRPGRKSLQDPSSGELLEVATHALKEFEVLEKRDWRTGETVQYLPQRDRDDLELWLMEQAFRYCRALCDQSQQPRDWRRARATLDHIDTIPPLRALDMLRRRLGEKLARSATPGSKRKAGSGGQSPHDPAPTQAAPYRRSAWLDDYLLGVAAELDDASGLTGEAQSQGAARALAYFARVLTEKPESFWGHYRSAVVLFRLKRWADAASHLDHCVRMRPQNAALRGQYASCLWELGLLDDAMKQCNRTIEAAPDQAEFYQARALVRATTGQGAAYRSAGWIPAEALAGVPVLPGQPDGLEEDLNRFEELRRPFGRSFLRSLSLENWGAPRPDSPPASFPAWDLDATGGLALPSDDPPTAPAAVDPVELDARAWLAWIISRTGLSMLNRDLPRSGTAAGHSPVSGATPESAKELAIASVEVDKVLSMSPAHLPALMSRMLLALMQGRLKEARSDLERVLTHPELAKQLREDPERFEFFRLVSLRFARYGFFGDALRIADTMISLSEQLNSQRGRSYYAKATVLAMATREDPSRIGLAADHLQTAFEANTRFWEWYRNDHSFDEVRILIDAQLAQSRAPVSND
jgi:serine/threonine protein kinase